MQIPNLHKIVKVVPWKLEEIPEGWNELTIAMSDMSYYKHRSGVLVIASIDTMADGTVWKHVSASRAGHNPSWEDMYGIKRVFFGDDSEAIQVFPKLSDLVDITDCLHIWSLD